MQTPAQDLDDEELVRGQSLDLQPSLSLLGVLLLLPPLSLSHVQRGEPTRHDVKGHRSDRAEVGGVS